MKITVQNYTDQGEKENVLHVAGVIHNSPSGVYHSLRRTLNAAKAMWPDDPELKQIYIVNLSEEGK